MKRFFTEKKIILIIIIAAILVRLLYLPVPFIINAADGAGYVQMGDSALKGDWILFFDGFIYRTPVYSLFIAFIKIIFGKFWIYGLAWIQHLLGVVMAVLVYFIGKKVFSKTVGFWAGLLTGINAHQVYWEHNSMSDFFFAFMIVLSFYFFLNALLYDKKRDYILFGIFFGLNLLTRPLFQAFFVIFPFLIYLFIKNKNFKQVLKRFAFIIIFTIIVISPWFFQHWYRHRYIGFTPFLGVQLMVRAQNYMDFESPLRIKEKKVYLQTMIDLGKCTPMMMKDGTCGQVSVGGWSDLQRKLNYTPVEADKALIEISLEAIRKNPIRYLRETIIQIQTFLTKHSRVNFYGDLDLDSAFREKYSNNFSKGDVLTYFHQRLNWFLTPKISYFVILAFLGMLVAIIKKNNKSFLFILVFLYILLMTCAIEEGGVTRYRLPADPFIFLFSSYALVFISRNPWLYIKNTISTGK